MLFNASKDANVCMNELTTAHFHCFRSSASCGEWLEGIGIDDEALKNNDGVVAGDSIERRE